ncbi:hypothetical protein GCM10027605_12140 [Micromonospora zhanjiangensis]
MLQAGHELGCPRIRELDVDAPLAVPGDGALQVQVTVSAADGTGGRRVTVHSRATRDGIDVAWVRNAHGTLDDATPVILDEVVWPPAKAEPMSHAGSDAGVIAAWRRGDDVYAEIVPAEEAEHGYGVHPALLDQAVRLHGDGLRPAVRWAGLSLTGSQAALLRVRATRLGPDTLALAAVDAGGEPVLVAASVTVGHVEAPAEPATSLYEVRWVPLETAGGTAATTSVTHRVDGGRDATEAAGVVAAVLPVVQRWLAGDPADESRLVLVTSGAVAARDGDVPDLGAAAVWGLVRAAQTEHPDRIVLVDADPATTEAQLTAAAHTGEPQIAIRDGSFVVPRLVRREPAPRSAPSWRDGTVLITGATGDLARLFARHLVTAMGVRRLVLASRRGDDAPGMPQLCRELTDAGAEVTTAVCDVADRAAVDALLAGLTDLRAVVHTAGVLHDGVVSDLDAGRLAEVWGRRPPAPGICTRRPATGTSPPSSCSPRSPRRWAAPGRPVTHRRTRSWTPWPSSAGPPGCRPPRWRGACGTRTAGWRPASVTPTGPGGRAPVSCRSTRTWAWRCSVRRSPPTRRRWYLPGWTAAASGRAPPRCRGCCADCSGRLAAGRPAPPPRPPDPWPRGSPG